ncbi:hypothetical protein BDQ17DRAFT_1353763 [Cyathus striatus]|nr:hypothetical protein BDQ17DRAFT_1353763 [Cyathus striatus]
MVPSSADAPSCAISLVPVKLTNIPAEVDLIADAQLLLERSLLWRPARFADSIQLFHEQRPAESCGSWHCVVTRFDKREVSFSKLWEKLGQNRMVNQKRIIPGLEKLERIEYISDSQSIWTLFYDSPPPLSPRVFTILQYARMVDYSTHRRTGIIISLPIDVFSSKSRKNAAEMEARGVKGRYACVEHVKEIDGGNAIEWRRVATVDFGGLVPKFFADRELPEKMFDETLHAILWLKQHAARCM